MADTGARTTRLPPVTRSPGLGERESAWIDVVRKMDEVYSDLITHQVELENKNSELEAAQAFIAGVLSSMSDLLVVCDHRGVIERVNHALEEAVDAAPGSLAGQRFEALFRDDSLDLVRRFPELVRHGAVRDREVSLRGRAGEPVPLSVSCTALRDQRGRQTGLVMVGRPIGELRRAYRALENAHEDLKQTQQQLIHAEKMASLGRLVAGVAHELNNPVSFVVGNVHALTRYCERIERYLDAVHGEEVGEAVESARRELRIDRLMEDVGPLLAGTLEGTERISEVVHALKRFSSTRPGTRTTVDLAAIARTAVEWVVKAERRRVQVDVSLPDALSVTAREGPVHQVLLNLVQNAVDALEAVDAPRIEIAGDVEGDRVRVRVRDNGPGIAEGALGKLFEPFYTTKPVGQGTGLGLYISYGIAAEHGGTLEAANHPDGGAMFTLELPAALDAQGAP